MQERDPRQTLKRLRAALGSLDSGLRAARQCFESERRAGWIQALIAVWRFLDSLDHSDEEALKTLFSTLFAALDDLDKGKVPDGLAPAKRRHRPPDATLDVAIRSVAAAAMDILVVAGVRKPEATKAVASTLDKHGFNRGKGATMTHAGRSVSYWRDRLNEGGDQHVAQTLYDHIKTKYALPEGTSPDLAIQDVIGWLEVVLSDFGFSKSE